MGVLLLISNYIQTTVLEKKYKVLWKTAENEGKKKVNEVEVEEEEEGELYKKEVGVVRRKHHYSPL